MPRLIAIGDMHGCLAALQAVLEKIEPRPDDTIVTLGDYVDRGPDSFGVIEKLIQLQTVCRLVPLLGNHDEMFLNILEGQEELMFAWLRFGGEATLASYHTARPERIPRTHVEFLRSCIPYFETNRHFFVHGSYDATRPLGDQDSQRFLWGKLRPEPPPPHYSGKIAVVGHTAQRNGQVLDLGYLQCIDTCCYGGGYLTALDVHSGTIWQADKRGRLPTQPS